jgi:hypothetical protein
MGLRARQPPHFMCQSNKELAPLYRTKPRNIQLRRPGRYKPKQTKQRATLSKYGIVLKTGVCARVLLVAGAPETGAEPDTTRRDTRTGWGGTAKTRGTGASDLPSCYAVRADRRSMGRRGRGRAGSRAGAHPGGGSGLPGGGDKRKSLRPRAPLSHGCRRLGPN